MNQPINIQFTDLAGSNQTFTGLSELRDFVEAERDFWKNARETLGKPTSNCHVAFNIDNLLTQTLSHIDTWSDGALNDTQLQQNINRLTLRTQSATHWLFRNHAFVGAFIRCSQDHSQKTAQMFLNFVTNKSTGTINDSESLTGAILGYEFVFQDSEIAKRRVSEKAAIRTMRTNLEKTSSKLIGEVEEFKQGYTDWNNQNKALWDEWVQNSENEYEAQQNSFKSEFDNYINDSNARRDDLENSFKEKLRLEAPATYWANSAVKFRRQGSLFFGALATSILLGICYMSWFFSSWLLGQKTPLEVSTLEGVVLFSTILATYAFLVRALSRLTFSSFHLMRDAEEREQLTYLYLSLVKDNSIDEGSRDIVLRALFSRTETGLLTSDSGPTMPGGISEIMKSIPK